MASAFPPEPAAVAPTAKAPWFGWASVVIGLLLATGVLKLAAWAGARLTVRSPAAVTTLFDLVVFAPLIMLAVLLAWVTRTRGFRAGDAPLRWAAVGMSCGLAGLLVSVAYAWLNGGLVAASGARPAIIGNILLGFGLTIFQASAEELFFRGWLLRQLQSLTSGWPAVLLSALAFSVFHALGGAAAILSFVNLLLGGMWFALLALRSGGLWAPIAAHAAWNAVEDLVFGLVPNPGTGELGAVSDHDLVGSAWWGGSAEGLNASIGTTVVLVALILPLARRPFRAA